MSRAIVEELKRRRAAPELHLTMASIDRVVENRKTIADLLFRTTSLGWGDYLITDESSLSDFATSDADLERMRRIVSEAYGIDVRALQDDRLVTIAEAIAGRGSVAVTPTHLVIPPEKHRR